MGTTPVCRFGDLEVERGVAALVHGQAVAIFRTHDDDVFALGNHDPFAGPRCWRAGSSGRRGEVPFVASPMHKHAFDLRTGRCLDDEHVSVPPSTCGSSTASCWSAPGRSAVPPAERPAGGPLEGLRVGVTASRKAEEQIALLRRRGALVDWAPVLRSGLAGVEDEALRAATARVMDRAGGHAGGHHRGRDEGVVRRRPSAGAPGRRCWRTWRDAEILARGPKTVGALRAEGLRELWSPSSECFDDVLAHLRGRDLTGMRIVVQEHGQSLSMVAHALRRQGAVVQVVTVYRVEAAADPAPTFRMVDLIADGELDAVTFTSAPGRGGAAGGGRGDRVGGARWSRPSGPTCSPPASAR